jgi:hypothetical protein
VINNLECIYYSFKILNEENIYKLIDKPKPYYIYNILNYCYKTYIKVLYSNKKIVIYHGCNKYIPLIKLVYSINKIRIFH